MITNKKLCPKDKSITPKSDKCKKCDYYNSKKWFNYAGEVETFCTFDMNDIEKSWLDTTDKKRKDKISEEKKKREENIKKEL